MTDLDLFAAREVRLALLIAAYGACAWMVYARYDHARGEFTDRPYVPADQRRADKNSGHAEIDFGGQYVRGRTLVAGHGRSLYDRRVIREVVRDAYPDAHGSPAQLAGREPTDADNLMTWFVKDPAPPAPGGPELGGPLYPPVHAFLYAPLALLPPQRAYAVFQGLSVALAVLAGAGVAWVLGRPAWWPAGAAAVLLFPGQMSGFDLGQNHALTLAVVVAGWVLRARGYAVAAGLVWGCLAFKPVWAVAFLLVPVALREWRFLLGMCAGGAGLVAATLPVVGVQAWLDWLAVGRLAAAEYEVRANWTMLSRDLGGLFRRLLTDYTRTPVEPHPLTGPLGAAAVAGVVLLTLVAAVRRVRPGTRDPRAEGFVLLGAYLACYRFMYYDVAVAALPALLLAAARDRWRPVRLAVEPAGGGRVTAAAPSVTLTLVGLLVLWENVLRPLALGGSVAVGVLGGRPADPGGMPTDAPRLTADTTIYLAADTVILLALWAWTGLRLWAAGHPARSAASAAPGSAARTSDSPTNTA